MDNNFSIYIQEMFSLEQKQVERLIEEFNSYYNESADTYIRRRHDEMKQEGLKNNEIFKILKSEISRRRFIQLELSERQIRRIIYG